MMKNLLVFDVMLWNMKIVCDTNHNERNESKACYARVVIESFLQTPSLFGFSVSSSKLSSLYFSLPVSLALAITTAAKNVSTTR